ncbi:GntR family transcriptional regulator [Pseudoclavibacter soli]|uniref:GntR family transcriptional regulator n=1 Tax=Pseudoclavibacter soli TaxID=452623 RepID=UPI0004244836|nr:GntR family transcriptional regulator [Pseudoclavibacter soli]
MAEDQANSKALQARDAIKRSIAAGRLQSGHRLVISQLARELKMSPVPVREAIRLLESEGLVTFSHNIGAQVADFDPDEYRHLMFTLAVLEGAAVAQTIGHMRPQTIEEARFYNQHLIESLNQSRFAEANRFSTLFHRVLYRDCPNRYLMQTLNEGWVKAAAVKGAVFGLLPGRVDGLVEEHEHLLQMIESGTAPDQVESYIRDHRQRNTNAYLRYAENTLNDRAAAAGPEPAAP